MLFRLKQIHETTGACFTLYVYEYAGDYSITNVPDKWKSEWEQNSHWLKIGYHGICPEIARFDENIPLDTFMNSYQTVTDSIIFFAGEPSLSQILRLSYFTGTEEIVDYLSKSGIKYLLAADDQRISYDLSPDENELLNQHEIFTRRNMTYLKTDIRYENTGCVEDALFNNSNEDILILFTHEWAFTETIGKVGNSAQILSECDWGFL